MIFTQFDTRHTLYAVPSSHVQCIHIHKYKYISISKQKAPDSLGAYCLMDVRCALRFTAAAFARRPCVIHGQAGATRVI